MKNCVFKLDINEQISQIPNITFNLAPNFSFQHFHFYNLNLNCFTFPIEEKNLLN